jgi:hypothetical protein
MHKFLHRLCQKRSIVAVSITLSAALLMIAWVGGDHGHLRKSVQHPTCSVCLAGLITAPSPEEAGQ